MNWTEFATIALIHLLAVASPGPDFAIVVAHNTRYGRHIAIYTSIGIGLGILVHVAYSLLGLSLIIATTPWLFNVFKYLAAAFLMYLAVGALRSRPSDNVSSNASEKLTANLDITPIKALKIGFITNGINPKATLFFMSLFTVVISPDTLLVAKIGYGLYLAVATGLWFCFLTFLLNISHVSTWLQKRSHWVDKSMGILLLFVAFNLLFLTKA